MSFRGLEAVKVKVWNEKTGGGVQWYVVCVCGGGGGGAVRRPEKLMQRRAIKSAGMRVLMKT